MKKIIVVVLLLISVLAWARTGSDPAEYTVNVHVSSSRIDVGRGYQLLNVVIDGKKYELGSELRLGRLLALGDYKARIVKDEHKAAYDSVRLYEFLFPDKKTRRFLVVGQLE